MNFLIYFCIPLVVTGRVTRGTYGIEDDEKVAIVETQGLIPSETSESYNNFYPGHIDYENPELKEYAVDHQDGTYYRKGVGEQAVLSKPVLLSTRGKAQEPYIPYSLRDKVRLNYQLRGQDPSLLSPAGVDLRYAQLAQGHAHGHSHSPIHSAGLGGGLAYPQYSPYQQPLSPYAGHGHYQNPYYASPSHVGPGPLSYQGGLHLDAAEQLPVAQHVVPKLHAPVKLQSVPLYQLYQQPQLYQVIKKAPVPLQASILPAIEHQIHASPIPIDAYHHHPKALLHKPVYTEKALLKTALAPAYHHYAKGIYKAPAHYSKPSHHEPEHILSTQKDLVKALISTDPKKGLGAHIELMPSLSYGYSYSLYPDEKGVYGPPEPHPDDHHHPQEHDPHPDDHHDNHHHH